MLFQTHIILAVDQLLHILLWDSYCVYMYCKSRNDDGNYYVQVLKQAYAHWNLSLLPNSTVILVIYENCGFFTLAGIKAHGYA